MCVCLGSIVGLAGGLATELLREGNAQEGGGQWFQEQLVVS